MGAQERLPDAIVIEHPCYAGGHLGATRLEDLDDPRFDFELVLKASSSSSRRWASSAERIPLIAAGGINSHEKCAQLLALGAARCSSARRSP